MYIPFAYSEEECIFENKLGVLNHDEMKNITETIDKQYCNCPSGAAVKKVWYLCPGTCLDYGYENLKIPYTFAWEIYGDIDEGSIFLQLNSQKTEKVGYNIKYRILLEKLRVQRTRKIFL